jgi:hypothetical protein
MRHGRHSGRVAAAITVAALLAIPAAASAHGTGLLVPAQASPDRRAAAAVRAAATAIPDSVDLTPYAVAPGDQGQVNSCAAWATDYTALGYWENRLGIPGGVLAPMYTYSQIVGGRNVGTYFQSHLTIASQQGVDTQADYSQGNVDYWDTPTAAERANASHWQLTGYEQLPVAQSTSSNLTQQSIESALADGRPVVVGFPVDYSFESLGATNHGYYAGLSGQTLGLHGVAALGYDASGLRIENSWGSRWGDHGYATLSWSFVNARVSEAIAVGPLAYSGLSNTARPTISGAGVVGTTLTASGGTWNPAATSYSYQWERSADGGSWSAIAGATGAAYVANPADVGSWLRVDVTATGGSTLSGNAWSDAIGRVTPGAPVNGVRPVVSGILRAGHTLTSTTGAWSPAATSYRYQWQRSIDNGASWFPIVGATGAAYTLRGSDVDGEVLVTVTASNALGQGTARSDLTGTIVSGAPRNSALPVLRGIERAGKKLTATRGAWDPAGSSYSFRWQRSRDGGFTWRYIAGASRSSYRLATSDAGAVVRAQVTASNAYGSARVPTFMTGRIAGQVRYGKGQR